MDDEDSENDDGNAQRAHSSPFERIIKASIVDAQHHESSREIQDRDREP